MKFGALALLAAGASASENALMKSLSTRTMLSQVMTDSVHWT